MTRFRWQPLAAAFILALASPVLGAPRTDRPVLAQAPATAPVVVHLRGIEGSAGRALAYFHNALPELAPLAELQFKQLLENGIDGRKFRGLAKDGPILVVFSELPKPDEKPKLALIAAVSDYKAFRDGILKDEERKALRATDKPGCEKTTVEDRTMYLSSARASPS